MRGFRGLVLLACVLGLTACNTWWPKSDDEDKNPFAGYSEQKLYSEAKSNLDRQQYKSAIKRLEAMESMYPFSNYAEQSQLDLIYAYYKDEDYPSAAAASERFIHLYPRAAKVDYAYYMKGLADFQQTRGTFSQWLPLDESWRDPGTQSVAYTDFATLIERFPNSKYKANALQRMIYLRNMFAQRQLNTAKFYFDRQMYVAAIERSSYLVKTYPQAPSVQEALVIMKKANERLSLSKASKDAAVVYQSTYGNKQVNS